MRKARDSEVSNADGAARRAPLPKPADDPAALKLAYRRIVAGAIATFVDRLARGEIVVTTVSDIERLMKLDMLLIGEPDEPLTGGNEEVFSLENLTPEQLRARLAECLEALSDRSLSPRA